jgi:predicted Zn-dependent peptidase
VRIARIVAIGAALGLPAAAAGGQERVVVLAEPGTPVVATEVLVAVGPGQEPAARAGITYLTARAVTAPVLPRLESLAARLTIEQHRDAVSFTVVAAPDSWEQATRALLVALFRDGVDSVATVRERGALVAELRAREGSPADAVRRELDAAAFGPSHPWGRPATGTPRGVERITVRDVDEHLREAFTPERAVVAIVGPVGEDAARSFDALLQPGPLRAPPGEPVRPGRTLVRRQYEAITAWVAASYRFAPGADLEAIEMVARLAVDRLSFGLLRPQVYDTRASVVRDRQGGDLRLQLVIPPAEVEEWGRRLVEAVAFYGRAPLEPEAFGTRLRRHRGERLLELDSPEARARHLAQGAFLEGAPGVLEDLESLTPDRLRAAVLSLASPVMVFMGPFVEDDGARPAADR